VVRTKCAYFVFVDQPPFFSQPGGRAVEFSPFRPSREVHRPTPLTEREVPKRFGGSVKRKAIEAVPFGSPVRAASTFMDPASPGNATAPNFQSDGTNVFSVVFHGLVFDFGLG
jgi:hypothetical protein